MKDRKKYKPAAVEETVQLMTFRVGAEEYGVGIEVITEVVRPLKITALPKMPVFVEGVINLRGVIIPIVDLRSRFELRTIKNEPKKIRMIITRGALHETAAGPQALLGVVVDSVNEVIHVPKKDIDTAPQAATGRDADFITGMGKVGDRLIILLDITRILSRQERLALEDAGRGEDEKVGR